MLSVVMLNVTNKPIVLNVVIMSVVNKYIVLSVVMLSVVAPSVHLIVEQNEIRLQAGSSWVDGNETALLGRHKTGLEETVLQEWYDSFV
jgi:hypothetical protein